MFDVATLSIGCAAAVPGKEASSLGSSSDSSSSVGVVSSLSSCVHTQLCIVLSGNGYLNNKNIFSERGNVYNNND